jgi:hypothetical protein
VFLVKLFIHADALLALVIGLYILWESFVLGRKATDCLLDASAGEEVEYKIKAIAEEQKIKISGLKTQKRGPVITANLEIELPTILEIDEATRTPDLLREALINGIRNLEYVAVQIKSREISAGFYHPRSGFGRGFGWQRKGRTDRDAWVLSGSCICPGCGYETGHERGVPCSSVKCNKCGVSLTRKM